MPARMPARRRNVRLRSSLPPTRVPAARLVRSTISAGFKPLNKGWLKNARVRCRVEATDLLISGPEVLAIFARCEQMRRRFLLLEFLVGAAFSATAGLSEPTSPAGARQ